MCTDPDSCDQPKFASHTQPVARKQHVCIECKAHIPKGEKHHRVSGMWEDGLESFRWHQACEDLRDFVEDVVCGGEGIVPFGCLYEEVMEAGEYLDQDHDSWERAGLPVPNPLREVYDEIRSHYAALQTEKE